MTNAYFKEEKTGLITKILKCLFPSRHCSAPVDVGFTITDELHTVIVVNLSVISRIRLIISGSVTVINRTVTEKEIGRNKSNSTAFVNKPFYKIL